MPRTARVVAFSTTPEMAEEIDRIARSQERSRSAVLRSAFEHYAAETPAPYAPAPPVTATPAPSLPGLAHVLAHRDEIRGLCQELEVRRLWIYGSAVRDDFKPGRSDFDFQVEWELGSAERRSFSVFFKMQQSLQELLGRSVDLGEAGVTRNPYIRAAIEGERLVLYDAEG